jgi:MFS family permease
MSASQPAMHAPRPPYVGVLLVSLAMMGLELTLTRIFSFTIWYHFAYLTINAALLGFCSAGAIFASSRGRLSGKLGRHILWCSALLSAMAAAAFLCIASRNPLQPQLVFSEPWTFAGGLALYYVGVALPFFLAGICVVAAFAQHPAAIARIYFADLAGAGLGASDAIAPVVPIGPPRVAELCVGTLILGAAWLARSHSRPAYYGLLGLFAAMCFACVMVGDRLDFLPSSSTLVGRFEAQPDKFRLLYRDWNAVGRVDVFQNLDPGSDWSYPQWTWDGNSRYFSPRRRPPPP